jgi:hypothetical protein
MKFRFWLARLFWTKEKREQEIINSLLLPSLKIPAVIKQHRQARAILARREAEQKG